MGIEGHPPNATMVDNNPSKKGRLFLGVDGIGGERDIRFEEKGEKSLLSSPISSRQADDRDKHLPDKQWQPLRPFTRRTAQKKELGVVLMTFDLVYLLFKIC